MSPRASARLLVWSAVVYPLCCVPDARPHVEPQWAGETGAPVPAEGGAAPSAGAACPAPSDEAACELCLEARCLAESEQCSVSACACGDEGSAGQLRCLLGCVPPAQNPAAVDACASSCGFESLARADPATQALFACLAADCTACLSSP